MKIPRIRSRIQTIGIALSLGIASASTLRAQKPVLIFQDGSGGNNTKDPNHINQYWSHIATMPFDGMTILTTEGSWVMANGSKNEAETLVQLTYALRRADTEVTYYAQQYDWFSVTPNGMPLPTPALITAVANARNTAATREPDTTWYSTAFSNANDWTPTGGAWSIVGNAYQKDDFTNNHSRITGSGKELPLDPDAGDPLTWTDYEVTAKVRILDESPANAGKAGLLARYQSTGNHYSF